MTAAERQDKTSYVRAESWFPHKTCKNRGLDQADVINDGR